jgi:hypothetical protein
MKQTLPKLMLLLIYKIPFYLVPTNIHQIYCLYMDSPDLFYRALFTKIKGEPLEMST